MNSTKEYYNNNAKKYIDTSFDVDLSAHYSSFLDHIPKGGRIIDVGCGSCRDTVAFLKKGYNVEALDEAEEICKIVYEQHGIEVISEEIEEWNNKEDVKYDGIWACASLHHLEKRVFEKFIDNLPNKLKDNGVCYISVKSGIETGCDELGRFQQDYSVNDIQRMVSINKSLEIINFWNSNDNIGRNDFQWLNVIIQNRGGI